MHRRTFLQSALVAGPVARYTDQICAVLQKVADMNTRELIATAYYRKTIAALQNPPDKNDWEGWNRKLYVTFQGGAEGWFWVEPYNHYIMGIEGSGLLDISTIVGRENHLIPLCYSSKNHWVCRPSAQWGVGNRLNPLVPGRDFANSQWQFGTRITWGVPMAFLTTFRPVMYCADVFGDPDKPDTRVDLFSGAEIDFSKPTIRAEVTPPENMAGGVGINRQPVQGCQQCLNLLKIPGRDGGPLKEDNEFGPQTNSALQTFLGANLRLFPYGLPKHREPNDPEIYFWVRKTAKENG